MRTIKFRGKRIDTEQFVYGHYFKSPLTDENSGTTSDKGWFFLTGETRHCIRTEHFVAYVVDEKTVGEFTGLTDKNGKEIYEGDIVNNSAASWVVKFNRGCFCGDMIKPEPLTAETLIALRAIREVFVIGNIYENPELLK